MTKQHGGVLIILRLIRERIEAGPCDPIKVRGKGERDKAEVTF